MRAWWVETPGPVDDGPLRSGERPDPEPGPGEIRVRVSVCGVCRTDLHVVDGDLPAPGRPVVPGHQIVGRVEALGEGVDGLAPGDRGGVPSREVVVDPDLVPAPRQQTGCVRTDVACASNDQQVHASQPPDPFQVSHAAGSADCPRYATRQKG